MADVKRLQYFNGQFLVEKDFQDEQAYHRDMRHRHNRALHSWGVAEGLDVSKSGDKQVTIAPGTAMDRDGNEIVLVSPSVQNLGQFAAGSSVYVTISYEDYQDPADKYPSLQDKYTRMTERAHVDTGTAAPPADGSVVPLVRVLLDVNGNVQVLDTTGRRAAGAKLAVNTVGTQQLADSAVTSAKIADGNVGTAELTDGAVIETKLASNAVSNRTILSNAVTMAKIADGNVTEAKLADNAVSNRTLQNNVVNTIKIADGAVTDTKLANHSVTAAKIADGNVGMAELADGAVTETKLATNAVSNRTIQNNAVTGVKIAAGAITKDKLDGGAARGMLAAFLAYNGSNGQIMNSYNVASVNRIGVGQYDVNFGGGVSPFGPFAAWSWTGTSVRGRGSGANFIQLNVVNAQGQLVDDFISLIVAS